MSVIFGPAGLGPVKTAEKVLDGYNKKGFKACEIAFTYSAYIKNKEDAERIGKKAKELGISLSIHAPYFINLNSEEKVKREASRGRIIECCKIGVWLGAKVVVFHPGYYGKNREETYDNVKEEVVKIMDEIKENDWKIKIAPETMGKVNVFGSVEDISNLVKDTGCSFCIDFAHILARDKKVDYEKVKRLFPYIEWHVHFSGIEYGEKGEKNHKKTSVEEWTTLLRNVPKDKKITIVNESPEMIEDSSKGLEIYNSLDYS